MEPSGDESSSHCYYELTDESFDTSIQKPFESTYAPTSSHALRDLARVFSGDDSRSLFLRLDSPAIYLVVATVLQFPPCSLLKKTVYFFMVWCIERRSFNAHEI